MSKMIAIAEDGHVLSSEPITAYDFLHMTLDAQLNLFQYLVSQGQPKEELFNLANETASAFLETFAPEICLHPDLTEEAILEAENKLLRERAAQVISEPDFLIPLDSLDDNGHPKKPVHKKGN